MADLNEFMPDFANDDAESLLGDSHPRQESRKASLGGLVTENPFMPVFDSPDADLERDRLGFSMREAVKTDPDSHARVMGLSKRTAIPPTVVERNQDTVTAKTRLEDMDLDGLADRTPATAKWLSDPDNAKLVSDDIENLTASESMATRIRKFVTSPMNDIVTSNLGRGAGERFFQIAGGAVRFFGTLAATADETIDDLADFLEENIPLGQIEVTANGIGWRPSTPKDIARDDGIFQTLTNEAAGALADTDFGYTPGTTWEDVKDRPLSNFLPFALEQGIVSLPDMAAVMVNLPLYIAGRAGEIGQTRAENDKRDQATVGDFLASAPAAIGSALLERLGARGILGLDDAVKTFRDVPGAIVKATVKEAGTEAGQEAIEATGETLGTERGFDLAETAERALAGAVGGGPFGGGVRTVTGTVQAATRFFGDVSRANKAKDAQALIDEAAEQARNSKLRQRSPDKFREHLEQAAPDSSVYVSTDALVELFQAAPEAGAALAENVEGFRERMQEAQAGDGFIEIPYSSFMSDLASLEEFEALIRENTKFAFDEFTSNEATAFENDIADIATSEVETLARTSEGEKTATAAADRAGDRVQEQLTRAGRSTSVAQDEAVVHRAFARVLQERYGLAPDEVDGLYGNLAIKGQLPESLRAIPVDQLDLLLDRVRTGSGRSDNKVLGESLVDFVRRLGVNDDRGDLRGLDVDVELGAFVQKMLRDDGLSIDDVALERLHQTPSR